MERNTDAMISQLLLLSAQEREQERQEKILRAEEEEQELLATMQQQQRDLQRHDVLGMEDIGTMYTFSNICFGHTDILFCFQME